MLQTFLVALVTERLLGGAKLALAFGVLHTSLPKLRELTGARQGANRQERGLPLPFVQQTLRAPVDAPPFQRPAENEPGEQKQEKQRGRQVAAVDGRMESQQ